MPLFIVSTPIGNSNDITIRAKNILNSCALIISENTRTTNKLLQMHEIFGKKIMNFTDHTEEKYFLPFLEIAQTQDVCLVSEAGTPIIADPGYKIIKKAIEMGVKVLSVPGASSLTAAISVSGLPFYNFAFLGFYEKNKIPEIKNTLNLNLSIILFVPARDISKTLQELEPEIGNRQICIARELTKLFEDVKTANFQEIKTYYESGEKLRGEAILMISGILEKTSENPDISTIITQILLEKPFLETLRENDLSEILKCYEKSLQSFSKKQIYNQLLKRKII
jgi:16S rRNA (cytidine1402-2'-O)-methyltransferase